MVFTRSCSPARPRSSPRPAVRLTHHETRRAAGASNIHSNSARLDQKEASPLGFPIRPCCDWLVDARLASDLVACGILLGRSVMPRQCPPLRTGCSSGTEQPFLIDPAVAPNSGTRRASPPSPLAQRGFNWLTFNTWALELA